MCHLRREQAAYPLSSSVHIWIRVAALSGPGKLGEQARKHLREVLELHRHSYLRSAAELWWWGTVTVDSCGYVTKRGRKPKLLSSYSPDKTFPMLPQLYD